MSATKKQMKKARREAKVKAIALAPVMIPVLRVTNPFDPRQFVREELQWQPTKTVAAYFPLQAAELVISINGKIVDKDKLDRTYLDKTDNVVVCPVPTGGGGGKGILSIVAMIAIAVVTAGAGLAIAGAMGLTGTALTVGGAIIQAGIVMAGGMLVSAVFAPPKPTPKKSDQTSASYGVDGAKNTSVEGVPVPVTYGEFRQAGNVISMHVDNIADDNQILYILLNAGEGPVVSLSDIQINDNPVSDYKDIEVQTRLGNANQTPIPWFNENIAALNKNQKLTTDWFYAHTESSVDKLRVDFVAPQGLCEIDKKTGDAKTWTVGLEVEIRPYGGSDAEWNPMTSTSEIVGWEDASASFSGESGVFLDTATGRGYTYGHDGSIQYTDWSALQWRGPNGEYDDMGQREYLDGTSPTVDGGNITARVPVYGTVTKITGKKKGTSVRRSFTTPRMDAGKYEIRVRRSDPDSKEETIVDDIYLTDLNEITMDTMTYPHTALVGLKIRLSDQISSMPKVSFLHGGRLVQCYGRPMDSSTSDQWFDAASQNPAWIVWDILTNRRYGGAMPINRLDFEAFKVWAAYCDKTGLKWNGPMDSEMNVWDACQLVLRVGHSQLVNVGTRYTIVTEKPGAPVMMFSVANMIEGSYKETWLGMTDRANEIDVTFSDKTDNYKQRTVKVYDPAALTAGLKQQTSAITLYGVTDYETAYKEAQFQLNLNRFILKTVNFAAPLEAVACSVGDLIYVQHDMTDWAVAGRLEAGSTTSMLKLDRDVTMEAGKQYKALVLRDAVERTSGQVYNVVGDSMFLTNFRGDVPVKRIQIGGKDLRVAGIFDHGAGYGVIVDNPAGIAPGAAYTLWDTDVIEEHNIVNKPGTAGTVTLQAPASSAPAQFTNFMFGEADKVKKPFRVKSISGSHEYKREIMAIEYKPEVYEFDRYGTNVPVLPPKDGIIGPVKNLTVYEETYISGSSIVSNVAASWTTPATGLYAGADVYVQRNDGPMNKEITASNRTSAVIPAAKGEKLSVKVVAYDLFNKRSQFELAPTANYTVLGEIPDIDVGGVTGAGFTWAGRDCKITWRYNSVTHSYEFGSEPTGADAGALDPHFKDYEIRVYDQDHKVLRRTEYTTDNSYTYIYDKNFADGVTRHLVFEIRMRDTFNNLGKPATLDAYNPPPQVTSVAHTATFESATITYSHNADPDFAGARIWMSDVQSDLAPTIPSDSVLVYSGPDSAVLLPKLMFTHDYYYKIAAYDAFGPTELKPTGVQHFKTTNLNVDAIADGVLKDTKLTPQLQTRIDLIDAPATVVGSVAQQVLTVAKSVLDEAVKRGTAITELTNVVNKGDSQLAQSITTLTATVNNDIAAAIQKEAEVRASQDAASAREVTTLAAKVGDNTAAIQKESSVRADADKAIASDITSMAVKVANNTAAITNEATVRADADKAEATQRNEQMAQFDTNIKSYVQNYSYSKATADSTINQVYQTLRSEFASSASGTLLSAQAYVQNYSYTKAEANSAIASQVGQVTSRLNNVGGVTVEQALNTSVDRINGLSGQYTVKIDNNGYVAGFGLASTNVNGTPTSEFIVRADVFGVVMPSYPTVKPFTIGAVNGIPRVIISSALIGDASIGNAQIGNATINGAKIQNAAVDTLTIAGNAVTMAASAQGRNSVSITINAQGAPVWLSTTGVFQYRGSGSSYYASFYMNILRDGQLLSTAAGYGVNPSDSLAMDLGCTNTYIDHPPAGIHTYTFMSPEGGQQYQVAINAALLETRR